MKLLACSAVIPLAGFLGLTGCTPPASPEGTPRLTLTVAQPAGPRLSPAAVFVSIDPDRSSTGDGASWDQCRITWRVERTGGLDAWPAAYRQVPDPRPGTGGAARDLASAERGFSVGWVLSEGDWTITCAVENTLGLTATARSSAVSVAAGARTVRFVDSQTGTDSESAGSSAASPYASLAYGLAQNAGRPAMEYMLAGGHVETLSKSRQLRLDAPNTWLRWDGTGAPPALRTTTLDATQHLLRIEAEAEGAVIEGLDWTPQAAASEGAAIELLASHLTLLDCRAGGDDTQAHFNHFVQVGGAGRVIMQHCETTVTRGYSLVWPAGATSAGVIVLGCTLGPSLDESTVRTTTAVQGLNLIYNELRQDGEKSALRLTQGRYGHAYGNHIVDGDLWLGNAGDNDTLRETRFEANYCSGPTSVSASVLIERDVDELTICNNVIEPVSGSGVRIQSSPDEPVSGVRVACNTFVLNAPARAIFVGQAAAAIGADFRANLTLASNAASEVQLDAFTSTGVTFADNVWTPVAATGATFFARIDGAGFSLAQWNGDPLGASDLEGSGPGGDPFTTGTAPRVPTPPFVWDDYLGAEREARSAAGAVNAP